MGATLIDRPSTALTQADIAGAGDLRYAQLDAYAFNNILINGGMEIDQEHAGAATTGNVYSVDGWRTDINGTMAVSVQQVADAPPGFSNSLKITVSTAQASLSAGNYTIISQPVEGFRTSRLQFGTAAALSITLGFWTKAHRTGSYSGSIRNAASNRSYPFTFTQNVADTWEYKTVTIPGDIAGTWVGNTNASALYVIFAVASGTTFTGTANTWTASNFLGVTGTTNGVAATTDVFQITGVSMLPGSIAPSAAQSALLKRPYMEELRLCQRYYFKSDTAGGYGVAVIGNAYTASTYVSGTFAFPARMRALPSCALYAVGASLTNASSFSIWVSSPDHFIVYAQSANSGSVIAYGYGVVADARL